MSTRLQRQLEEVLALPGNNNCADCHSPAPRWASINLGIFLCVSCASVHRKLGTHKSRVKSVTLDTWTREQIQNMKQIGNIASNSIYNPNESLHPPPTSTGDSDERDSEIERYIRKKYELGAFKAGPSSSRGPAGVAEPTSLNRYKDSHGLSNPPRSLAGANAGAGGAGMGETSGSGVNGRTTYPVGGSTWDTPTDRDRIERSRIAKLNQRNPELNDVLQLNGNGNSKDASRFNRDRDLPALPSNSAYPSTSSPFGNSKLAPPRDRPGRPPSANGNSHGVGGLGSGTNGEMKLVDIAGSTSSTLPLQLNVGSYGNQSQSNLSQPQPPSQPQIIPQSWGTYGSSNSMTNSTHPSQASTPQFQSQSQSMTQSSYNPFYQNQSQSMAQSSQLNGGQSFISPSSAPQQQQQHQQPPLQNTSYYPNGNAAAGGVISPYMLSPQNPFFQQHQLQQQQRQHQSQQQQLQHQQQAYNLQQGYQNQSQQYTSQQGYTQPMQMQPQMQTSWNGLTNGYTQNFGMLR